MCIRDSVGSEMCIRDRDFCLAFESKAPKRPKSPAPTRVTAASPDVRKDVLLQVDEAAATTFDTQH
jgi:hypothetical protein